MSDNKKEKTFVPDTGTRVPWKIKKEELGELPGNEDLVKKQWESIDSFAYSFIWFWVQR